MGFLSKIFKPVSKVLDKIVPNEIKPLLPYAAAFAPMFLGPGIMGSSMLSRGLISGGLNIGAQLAQEGNEGDINALSALMAGGIGALTTPGTNGKIMGVDKFDNPIIQRGPTGAQEFLTGGIEKYGADSAMGEILGGVSKASKFLTDPGLLKYGIPVAQATGDLAYADAQRALRDYENSQGGGSGYEEGDQNRGLAVRRAMERGGHEEQTIRDMLESLGYEDPDPQDLAYGGRVGYALGDLVTGSGMFQPTSASMRSGDRPMMGGSGMGGMLSNMINNNPQLFSNLSRSGNVSAPNNDIDFIDENRNGIDDRQEKSYGGRVNAMNGGIMSNQRGLVNQPGGYAGESGIMGIAGPEVAEAMGKKIEEKTSSLSSLITDDEGDVYKPLQYLRKFGEDAFFGGQKNPELPKKFYNKLGDEYIQEMDKIKNKEPNFNSMAETVEAVEETPKEMLVDKLRVIVMPGQSEQRAIIEAMYSDVDGVMPDDRKKEFYELYAPQMYRNGEMDKAEFEFIQTEILDKDIKEPIAKKDGGMMSVLPEGMEMDYRGGGFIPMGSKERADDVPARVSKNEFVMTADAVKAAGGGSVNEGARRMYNLMNNLEARA
mgnify:FL=1